MKHVQKILVGLIAVSALVVVAPAFADNNGNGHGANQSGAYTSDPNAAPTPWPDTSAPVVGVPLAVDEIEGADGTE